MFYTSEIYCQFQCGKKKKKKIILPLIKLLHNLKIKGRKNTSFLHKLSTISTILARLHQGGKRHRPILPCTKILRPVNWTTKGPVESRQFTKTKDPRSYKVISCARLWRSILRWRWRPLGPRQMRGVVYKRRPCRDGPYIIRDEIYGISVPVVERVARLYGCAKTFRNAVNRPRSFELENGSNTSRLVSFPSVEYAHRSYEGELHVLSDDLTRVPRVPKKRAQKMQDKKFIRYTECWDKE